MRNIMSQEESNNPILKTTHEAMDYATVSNSSSSNNSTAPSDRRKKQVFAIRHGQSEWNVAIQQYYDKQVERRWCPETYKPDCNITVKGRQQALEAGKELSQLLQGQCYSIIASPLRRAIQTAEGVMESCATNCKPKQKIIDWRCAEVMVDSCDIGSPVEALQREFQAWDFKLLTEQNWWAYNRSLEETYKRMESRAPEGEENEELVQSRLKQFKEYIRALLLVVDDDNNSSADEPIQVDNLVIVAHSEIIWWLTSRPVEDGGKLKGVWTQNGQVVNVTGAFLDEYDIDESLLGVFC